MRPPASRYIPTTLLLGSLIFACQGDREAPVGSELDASGTAAVEPQLAPLSSDSMGSPVRLAVTRQGRLLVSDAGREMILAVDPATLRPDQGFAVGGKPLAVGLIGKRILVGNATRRTIEVYNAIGGSLLRSFGTDIVEHPTDLAVDGILGLVFVVDGGTREVKVFDMHGRLRRTISGPGPGTDQLQAPTAIAVDPVGKEVFVSDYGDPTGYAAVKIFDYGGNFVDVISGAGTCGMMGCSGGFSRPQGVELGGDNRIYVADVLLAQVLVFARATLEQVDALGGRAGGPPELRLPLDVAIGVGGDLFVANNRMQTIEVFPNAAGSP